jgi:hypothetical protein
MKMNIKISLYIILLLLGLESSYTQVQQEWLIDRHQGTAGRFVVYDTSGFIYTSNSIQLMDSPPKTELAKYSTSGVQHWYKTHNGHNRGLSLDNSHYIYTASYTYFDWGAPKQMNLIKYDTSGTEVWRVNDTLFQQPDALVSMKGDYAGNSYMLMYRDSLFELSKYDSSGTRVWMRYFNAPGSSYNIPMALELDKSGNAFVIGESVYGNISSFNLVKYNSTGVQQWISQYSWAVPLTAFSVSIASDTAGSIFAVYNLRDTSYVSHLVIVKYNSAGAEQWSRIYGQAVSIDQVYTFTDISGNVISAINYSGIIKYSGSGVFQWYLNTNISAITADKNLNIYFTRMPSNNSFELLKCNSSGNYQWQTLYTHSSNCNYLGIGGIIIDTAFNIYITGGYQFLNYPFWNPASITAKYSQLTGITNTGSQIPKNFSLHQNYPNPFNPSTKIRFDIPPSKGVRGMTTQLIIYDVLGREVAALVDEELKPGTYEVEWDGSNYPSGVYFYKLILTDASAPANGTGPLSIKYSETKKMVLIK